MPVAHIPTPGVKRTTRRASASGSGKPVLCPEQGLPVVATQTRELQMLRLLYMFLEACASGTAVRATLLPRLRRSCGWRCSRCGPRKPEAAVDPLPP